MAGENNIRDSGRCARITESGGHHLAVHRLVVSRWRRWERRRPFDQLRVVLQPLAVIERDGSDDATVLAERGRKPTLLDIALGEHDLVAERAHTATLDVDAELAGPELRQRKMRAALHFEVNHVVRSGLRTEDRGIHVLDRHELVLVEHMRRPRDITRDEDVVGDDAVDVEGTTAGIAGNTPKPCGQVSALKPFDVADRPQ